ncbi:hypothetical protein [Caballeronia sp. ATUFL_M2_KS44]|nr:hypothetical protein [Caballeronia sp. ATUFL_M2_KS44]
MNIRSAPSTTASDLELAQTFAETAAIIISRDVNAGATESARV